MILVCVFTEAPSSASQLTFLGWRISPATWPIHIRKGLQILHKTSLGSIYWCLTKNLTICQTLCTPAQTTWAVSAISCTHPKMVNAGFGPWCQCLVPIFGLRCALKHVKTVLKPLGRGLSEAWPLFLVIRNKSRPKKDFGVPDKKLKIVMFSRIFTKEPSIASQLTFLWRISHDTYTYSESPSNPAQNTPGDRMLVVNVFGAKHKIQEFARKRAVKKAKCRRRP